MKDLLPQEQKLFNKILEILVDGRNKTYQTINENMLLTYWLIGKEIVDEEKSSKVRYGKEVMVKLSLKLSSAIGQGYSVDNLQRMRLFYLNFENYATLSRKLSWSHYVELIKLKDPEEIKFYYELMQSEWRSVRILKSEINSKLYIRQLAGIVVKEVIPEHLSKTENLNEIIISDPLVVDYLGFVKGEEYLESELEARILQNIQRFMLELGKGFAFVARQQIISMDGRNFRIDLVFYNYILKCFVLVDLKTKKVTHGDLGQMMMYVNFYDEEIIKDEDNRTIGIVVAREKDDFVIKYTLGEDNKQIFTTKYQEYIPTESQFKSTLETIDLEDKND